MRLIQISDFKNYFDPKLNLFLDKKLKRFEEYKDKDNLIYEIVSHTRDVLRHGGKRVRPYMAYLGAMMSGKINDKSDLDRVMDAVVGLELFHGFALIHDDVIDRGHERHGIPTIHQHIRSLLKENKKWEVSDKEKINHIGDGGAILAGDLVFAWSKEALYTGCEDLSIIHRLRDIFAEMVEDVVVGQMLDVNFMVKSEVSTDLLEKKNILKTARYSFVHPLKIGDVLAGGDGSNDDFYEKFGEDFGIAYQIQDDMLDIIGDPAKTGKDNLLDLRDGQHTYFTQYIKDNGQEEQKLVLRDLFGRRLNQDEKEKAKKLFADSGSLDVVGKNIEKRINKADQSITDFGLKSPYDKAFHQIVEVLRARVS